MRASGPMLPRRVSMKSDTARTCDCAVNSAWSNARLQPLGGLAFLGDAGQQPVELGVGLRQLGEGAQRVGGAGALRVGDRLRPQRRGPRSSSLRVGRVALRQLSCPRS